MRMTMLTLTLAIASGVLAEAQTPVGAAGDLWMRVKNGDTVYVTDGSGQQTTGVLAKVSDSTLSLLVGPQLRDIPFTDVREVAKQGDSLWNGFLIGAGIGTAIGVAGLSGCDEHDWICFTPAEVAVGAAINGLGFGGVGALIDHFIKGRTVVFRVKTTALGLKPGFSLDRHAVTLSMALSRR